MKIILCIYILTDCPLSEWSDGGSHIYFFVSSVIFLLFQANKLFHFFDSGLLNIVVNKTHFSVSGY